MREEEIGREWEKIGRKRDGKEERSKREIEWEEDRGRKREGGRE